MFEVSVGQVSGVLNFALLLAQIIFPLLVVLALIGMLNENNNAVTWSVVCRYIHNTWLPIFLSSDSVAYRNVNFQVVMLRVFSTVGLVVLSVASVVTPLGLYEEISLSKSLKNVNFAYIKDTGSFGEIFATVPRDGYEFTRVCGALRMIRCPSQELPPGVLWFEGGPLVEYDEENYPGIGDWRPGNITSEDPENKLAQVNVSLMIPKNLTEAFTLPDSLPETVSGAFDMQYRTWRFGIDATAQGADDPIVFNQGRPFPLAAPQYISPLLLNNKYELIEGLIVNAIDGGIGLRNHTLPPESRYGTSWDEDLLWIQPETTCVNTNVSFNYELGVTPFGFDFGIDMNIQLVDRGGFRDINRDIVHAMDDGATIIDFSDPQANPDLHGRAWTAATAGNWWMMRMLNLTTEGTHIPENIILSNYYPHQYYAFAPILPFTFEPGFDAFPGASSTSLGLGPNISDGNAALYSANYKRILQGYDSDSRSSLHTIAIETHIVLGAASPIDPSTYRRDTKTQWSHPMYACSSAVYASIKRISFQFNASTTETGLAALKVSRISPLPDDSPIAIATPLWGVETPGWNVSTFAPLWGLVSEKQQENPGMSVLRSQKLYLPATDSDGFTIARDSLASARAPSAALSMTFAALSSPPIIERPFDKYTGESNTALWALWRNFSQSEKSMPRMFNLIWTDIMANLVVGIRPGDYGNGDGALDHSKVTHEVHHFQKQIRYRYLYGIPAVMFGVLFLAALAAFVGLMIQSKVHLEEAKRLLNSTGTGRVVLEIMNPDVSPWGMPTKRWIKEGGKLDIQLPFKGKKEEMEGNEMRE